MQLEQVVGKVEELSREVKVTAMEGRGSGQVEEIFKSCCKEKKRELNTT